MNARQIASNVIKWVTCTKQYKMRTRLAVKIKKVSVCMSHNHSSVTNRLMHNMMSRPAKNITKRLNLHPNENNVMIEFLNQINLSINISQRGNYRNLFHTRKITGYFVGKTILVWYWCNPIIK